MQKKTTEVDRVKAQIPNNPELAQLFTPVMDVLSHPRFQASAHVIARGGTVEQARAAADAVSP
jgi:hypothetical protein